LKRILFAFYQLTRLPLPNVKFDEVACGKSTAFFPLVGLTLGTLMIALDWAARLLFPVYVEAALLVVGMVVLTGGVHLDGFIDSIDGLCSGRSKERKLDIMRDSRVGAFGVVGVVCLLLLKYSLWLGLTGTELTRILLIVPTLSRWGMTFAITLFPYARPEGLGKTYAIYTGTKELFVSTLIAAAITGVLFRGQGFWLILVCAALTCLAGLLITKKLGGLTGDIYGFINEAAEVALLLAVYPVLNINRV